MLPLSRGAVAGEPLGPPAVHVPRGGSMSVIGLASGSRHGCDYPCAQRLCTLSTWGQYWMTFFDG
jgi:hypothetical protein